MFSLLHKLPERRLIRSCGTKTTAHMPEQRRSDEQAQILASSIRDLRQARGLTQQELARNSGVPLKSLQNWERGACGTDGPGLFGLLQLSDYFGVKVDQLLGGIGDSGIPGGVVLLDQTVIDRIMEAGSFDELEDLVEEDPGITFAFFTPDDPSKIRIGSRATFEEVRSEVSKRIRFLRMKRGRE